MATIFRPPLIWPIPPAPQTRVEPPPNLLGNLLLHADKFFGLSGNPTFDFPNPRGPGWPVDLRTGFVSGVNLNLLHQDVFYTSPGRGPTFDWSNPRLPFWSNDVRAGFVQARNLNLQDQFFTSPGRGPNYDWPNPVLRKPPEQAQLAEWPINLLGTTLAVPIGRLMDWPNPPVPRIQQPEPLPVLLTIRQVQLVPFVQADWPNPRGATWPFDVRTGSTYSVDLNLIGKDKFFGLSGNPNYDWPNPQLPVWSNDVRGGFVQARNLNLQDQFFGLAGQSLLDQPNPVLRISPSQAIAAQPPLNLILSTLFPVAPIPTPQLSWPLPPRAYYPNSLFSFTTQAGGIPTIIPIPPVRRSAAYLPLLPRQPTDNPRARRWTEQQTNITNSLIRQGIIQQQSTSEWSLNPPVYLDPDAPANQVYYSLTLGKLVYKSPDGLVHPLY